MTSVFSWQNSISLCPASFCTPRPICLLLQVFLDFLLLHSSPLWWKWHLFGVLVLEGLVGLCKIIELLWHSAWGIDLDYCDTVILNGLPWKQTDIILSFLKLHASTAFWTFCWLYRASPSLATKNIINLISVLTIWWCPCVESSLVLLEEGVCYDQCVLLAKLY